MAEITWTTEAQRWLEDIFEHVAADNPRAATRTVQGIYDRAQDLATFPEIGHRYLASSRTFVFFTTGITGSPTSSRTMEALIFSVSSTARSTSPGINFEFLAENFLAALATWRFNPYVNFLAFLASWRLI